ncbi:MAG: hypothetical protein ACKV19_20915 [Verrucomicrobiales bacterium]
MIMYSGPASSAVSTAAGARLRFVPLTPAPPPAIVGLAFRTAALVPPSRRFLETARALAARG